MKSNKWIVVVLFVLCVIIGVQTWMLWRVLPHKSQDAAIYANSYPVANTPVRKINSQTMRLPNASLMSSSFDPFEEMEQMQTAMNRMFKDSFGRASRAGSISKNGTSFFDPEVDMRVTDTEYLLRVDIPGIEKDKLVVKIENGQLILSGERSNETESADDTYYSMERSFGSFARVIPLPQDADTQGLTADSKDGVLTIHIPRVNGKQSSKRKIDVQ